MVTLTPVVASETKAIYRTYQLHVDARALALIIIGINFQHLPYAFALPQIIPPEMFLDWIWGSSIADTALKHLPLGLVSVVKKTSSNEIELEFPANNLGTFSRLAICADEDESLLIRLTLDHDGTPIKFCIHLSNDPCRQSNTQVSSKLKGHSPWEVFRGNRAPYEQYCYGRPNRGVYQLSRILWHHLRYKYICLGQTYTHMNDKIAVLGQGCLVCGKGQHILQRATICSSRTCIDIFSQAHIEIQLAELWHDPAVMEFIFTIMYAATASDNVSLLQDFPFGRNTWTVEVLDRLPAVPVLAKYLQKCLDTHEEGFNLVRALVDCLPPDFTVYPDSVAKMFFWACNFYRGFLVSLTGPRRLLEVRNFGSNQFLLASAAPDLEIAFNRHMKTLGPDSHFLFHGTTLDRVYPILCRGLRVLSNTKLQQTGAIFGPGVYVADDPRNAWTYAKSSEGGWSRSKLKHMRVILGCQLAGPKPPPPVNAPRWLYVIPDGSRLAVRHIFLVDDIAQIPPAKAAREEMEEIFRAKSHSLGGC